MLIYSKKKKETVLRIGMYTKLTGGHAQVKLSLKCNVFLSRDSQKTFIKGSHTTISVTFGKYFR